MENNKQENKEKDQILNEMEFETEEEFEIAPKGIGSEEKSEITDMEADKIQNPEEADKDASSEEKGTSESYWEQGEDEVGKRDKRLEEEKRESRKNRRVRNQIICYIVVMVIMVLVGIAIAWVFEDYIESQREARKIAQAQQNAVAMLEQQEMNSTLETETPESVENSVEETGESMESTEPEESVESSEEIQESSEPAEDPSSESDGKVQPIESQEIPNQDKLDAYIEEQIAAMSLEDKVAGLFIITPEALTKNNTVTKAAGGTKSALNQYGVGGLIYAKKNIKSASQVQTMLKNTREYSRYPLFMMVQEEGGSISPLADARLCEKIASPKEIGAGGDINLAYNAGQAVGSAMLTQGFDTNYLSIGNLANVEASLMEERSYAADAQTSIPYVEAMIRGLKEQGVNVCIGDFPGNGGVSTQGESGVLVNNRTAEEIMQQELLVLKASVEGGADIITISNVAIPSLTGDNTPAVFSDAVVSELIRKQYGYKGLIISGALDSPNIKNYYDSDEAAILALRAGCDMILLPEDFGKAYQGVLEAVAQGTISEERINNALKRIYRIKYAYKLDNGEIQ